MDYDVIIIGAGPGGIFAAYELMKNDPDLKVAVFDAGHSLENRKCPIDGDKIKSCINCKPCSIMSGFGGAGASVYRLYGVSEILMTGGDGGPSYGLWTTLLFAGGIAMAVFGHRKADRAS